MKKIERVLTPASYIIYTDGTKIFAQNGLTGNIDFSGINAYTVFQKVTDSVFNNGGGNIFIKAGKYSINNSILLKGYTNIIGEGRNSLLINNIQGGPIFQFVMSPAYDTYRTIFEKLNFTGGGPGTGPAIQTLPLPTITPPNYTLTDYITFRDLIIEKMYDHGILIPSRMDMCMFDNLIIRKNAKDGINANILAACKFIGCEFAENGGNGLYVTSGVGNYYNIYQAALNGQYGIYLNSEGKSEVHLMYSENNHVKGLYVNGGGCWVHIYNTTDSYTIVGSNSYTVGYASYPAEENPKQSKPDYLFIEYAIRPKTAANGAKFPLQKYVDGSYVDVASVGNGALDIYNLRTYTGNYGGNFSTFTPPPIKGQGHCFFVQDTNSANPGKRLYNSFDGLTWNYVNFQ